MQNEQTERCWQFGNVCLSLKVASEEDKNFCRLLHHEVYRRVVIQQFSVWDESLQDRFFQMGWNPTTTDLIHVDEKRVGCLCRIMHSDHIWIAEIQLLPEFQGQGIGSEILRREMNAAALQGVPIRLQVLKANERALMLYQRLGFRATGESDTHVLMSQ